MSVQDILVYIIMFLCVVYTGKHFLKFFKKKNSKVTHCNSGCSGCSLAHKTYCHDREKTKK